MALPILAMPADFPNPKRNGLDELRAHPTANYASKPNGPAAYVLVHKPPSWLLPVKNDKRDRTSFEYQAYFTRFAADVKQRGVQMPIIAVRQGELAQTVEGETRRLAALYVGVEQVPILLYNRDLSEADLVLAQLQANAMRRDFTPLELAQIYAQLMQLNGWTQAELARAVSVSPATVAKVLAVSTKLCEEVRAMVSSGELAPRAAYAISRVEVPAQVELAKQFKLGALCVEGVEAQVARLTGKRKAQKQKPVTVTVGGVTFTVTETELAKVQSAADAFKAGLKKIEQHGLPMSALPSVMKAN